MKNLSLLLLIFFSTSFLFPSSIKSLLPEIKDWKLSEAPKIFNKENLYEHINGGAEAYISFGFKELLVAYFEKENSSLTLEIYDMENAKNSFGIYSVERSSEYKFLEIGNHGYTDGENLFFIIGCYYIKIFCSDCGEDAFLIMNSFAKSIVEKVEDKGALPKTLNLFPEKGKIRNSEKFFPNNFLGLDFLRNGFTAEYEQEGGKFILFIIEENEKEVESIYRRFKSYLENREKKEMFKIGLEEGILAEDKAHKKIAIVRNGNLIIGYLGPDELEKIKGYLKETIEKIGGMR